MSIPVDSQERKDLPLFSGVMAYFPDALMEVARLSKLGNDKHNPGQPLHWARDKSTDHADCIARHQLEYDKRDEFGMYHAVAVAWRALAQLQTLLEKDYEQALDFREFDALEGPQPSKAEVRFGMATPKGPEPVNKFDLEGQGWKRWDDYQDYSFWLGKDG